MQAEDKLDNEQVATLVRNCYNEISGAYKGTIPDRENVYRLDAVYHFAQNVSNKDVLELGCGDCYCLSPILIERGINYAGVELSDAQFKMAKENLPEKFKQQVHQSEMFEFCGKVQSYTLGGVAAMFSICHLIPYRQIQMFQEIYRMLSANGLFLISTFYYDSFPETFEGQRKSFGYLPSFLGKPSYEASMTDEWVETCLTHLGFELVAKQNQIQEIEGKRDKTTFMVFRKKTLLKELTDEKLTPANTELDPKSRLLEYCRKRVSGKTVLELGAHLTLKKHVNISENSSFVGRSEAECQQIRKQLPEELHKQVFKSQFTEFFKGQASGAFGAVDALFSIGTLSPSQQVQLFEEVHRILAKDGLLLISSDQKLQSRGQSFEGKPKWFDESSDEKGCKVYSANFPAAWYVQQMKIFGFDLLLRHSLNEKQGEKSTSIEFMVFRKKQVWKKEQKKAI